MKKNGILGATTVFELGTAEDIDLFFDAVWVILEKGGRGSRFPVVMNRFYKYALRIDEIKQAKQEMDIIKSEMAKISVKKWSQFSNGINLDDTSWNKKSSNLAELFESVFRGFDTAYNMTIFLIEKYDDFVPMKIGRCDIPYTLEDSMRPPEEYDKLGEDDLPFWKR